MEKAQLFYRHLPRRLSFDAIEYKAMQELRKQVAQGKMQFVPYQPDRNNSGTVEIKCNLGLWGVFAPTRELAVREAYRYFRLYKSDGEYYTIIGGKSPAEILKEGGLTS